MAKRRDKDLETIVTIFMIFFIFSIWHVWKNYRTQFYLFGVLILVILIAVAVFVYRIKKRRFDGWYTDKDLLGRLRQMHPTQFEEYIADLYRRLGYRTERVGQSHDGGVDVIAVKDGIKHYIQCKKFITSKATVHDVRDFAGALIDKLARGKGVFITTNIFTEEAEQYAKDKPIELIDQNKLLRLIKSVNKDKDKIVASEEKKCPQCGGKLVEKTGKYGKFMGCSNYPKCKYTENINK